MRHEDLVWILHFRISYGAGGSYRPCSRRSYYNRVPAGGWHHANSQVDLIDITAVFDKSQQATIITSDGEKDCSLLINGKDATDFILQMQAEQQKPWHKKDKTKEWLRNLLIFLAVAGILMATYFLLVPWLSGKLASNVSIETEEEFGNAVFDALDLSQQQDGEATVVLNDFF